VGGGPLKKKNNPEGEPFWRRELRESQKSMSSLVKFQSIIIFAVQSHYHVVNYCRTATDHMDLDRAASERLLFSPAEPLLGGPEAAQAADLIFGHDYATTNDPTTSDSVVAFILSDYPN
jgi:hypothetical protein